MPFNDLYEADNGVQYLGFRTQKYCTIYWLTDGVRAFKTVCYDNAEMAYAVNNRTRLTDGLAFEVEYYGRGDNARVVSKTA